ncbi:hypothetical protein FD754_000481, partial [Muntiacus muntjak]
SQGLPDSSLMASGTASRSEDEESLAGQKRASSQALGTIPKRRSSSRFIKRKKFDDELVESSLAKSSTQAKGASGVEPGRCSGSKPSSSEKKVSRTPSTPVPPSRAPTPGLTKRVKKSKQPLQVTKDLGRWKPADDPLLINAMLQTNDLTSVLLGVKLSCRFTLREVQERWYALLYNPVISKLVCQAMRQLHPEAIAAIQSKALFSKTEQQLLSKVGSTSQPTLETFQDLLHRLPDSTIPPFPPDSRLCSLLLWFVISCFKKKVLNHILYLVPPSQILICSCKQLLQTLTDQYCSTEVREVPGDGPQDHSHLRAKTISYISPKSFPMVFHSNQFVMIYAWHISKYTLNYVQIPNLIYKLYINFIWLHPATGNSDSGLRTLYIIICTLLPLLLMRKLGNKGDFFFSLNQGVYDLNREIICT